ncbi:MAG: hypothetical protein DMF53_07725 [Acidobacteria bacterium]|nr:MAG: hypothetical protein DMF53_07725 [Acidobacteriota bacterium]
MRNTMSTEINAPHFGDGIRHLPDRCSPRDLYCRLLDPEENVHYFEPAFQFAGAALESATVPALAAAAPLDYVDSLIQWAADELANPPALEAHSASWPPRIAREFAPVGLADGAWLHGLVRANVVENEVGMAAIKQLMIRFGDPGSGESYAQRYGALLRSLGVPPAGISRWELEDASPCAEISYEHALLGLVLGLFPGSFRSETIGFNLWMAVLGPCPLLARLADELRSQKANLQYLDMYEHEALRDSAIEAAVRLLAEDDGERARMARGFAAAHGSYGMWEEAMLGRNVPMIPREFVLEMIKRKAHFALGHHTRISFGGTRAEDLFRGGETGHAEMLDHLVESGLIYPGSPDDSPFLYHSISFEGPMFDVFTAAEQRELREWVVSLKSEPVARQEKPPVALRGEYGYPQDPKDLQGYAMARFGPLPIQEQLYYGSNADLYPAVRLFARTMLDAFLLKLGAAFKNDPRLAASPPPKWSERAIAELVVERHDKNIRSRPQAPPEKIPTPMNAPKPEQPSIAIAFDGVWLQGFADVHRSDREEYGWLFRIYASEQGDGIMDWNHNRIMRNAVSQAGPEAMLPATDRRLYEFCQVNPMNLMLVAASLNTRHSLPELLGCNLGIEATGVGGGYLDSWRGFVAKTDNHWAALSFRLHNSIDNYVTGHTKWSLSAIQAFMARVQESAPAAVETQWQRIWRVWRLQEILEHGTTDERQALKEALGFDAASLAPIPAALAAINATSEVATA